MRALGHEGRSVTALKMDIEGNEFSAFQPYAQKGAAALPFKQVQLEVHVLNPSYYRAVDALMRWFTSRARYAIYHKEPSVKWSDSCVEFGFVRMAPSFYEAPSRGATIFSMSCAISGHYAGGGFGTRPW